MKRLNNAFTLTELMVALGVVGILCAILLPVIFNLMPNQNTIMAKRAYYTVQSVVSDLINDEACYPDKSAVNNPRIGFDDAAGSVNCTDWDEGHINDTGTSNAAKKFKYLFEKKLNLHEPVSGGAPENSFSTTDGLDWVFSNANFSSSGEGGSIMLTVDVNGKSKPNCGQANAYAIFDENGTGCNTRTNGFDRFRMEIKGNGQIEIQDDWAKEAVKVDRNITSDKNSNAEDD